MGVISGTLVGLGSREHEAKRYEDHVKDGGILLSVHCDSLNCAARVENVLEWTGAHDISHAGDNPNDLTQAGSDGDVAHSDVRS